MRRLPAESEAAFQTKVENLAAYYGWTLRYHAPDNRPVTARSGRRYVQNVRAGFPDLILIRAPELLVAELKTDTGRVSREQQDWLDAFDACDVETFIWRPRDFDLIVARLSRDWPREAAAA